MSHWTASLSAHHDLLRRTSSTDRLLVVFEVDRLPDSPPVPGGVSPVLEAWRWYQNQPGTGAALCIRDGGPGREELLVRLSRLARAHGLRVPGELVHLGSLATAPFAAQGWRVVARVTAATPEAAPTPGTAPTATGAMGNAPAADLLVVEGAAELAEIDLPRPVAEVSWVGLGTREDREAFLASSVPWGELPLCCGGAFGMHIADGERDLDLSELLGEFAQCGKGLRLELCEEGALLDRALRLLQRSGFPTEQTRLLASLDVLGRDGLRRVAAECPSVSLECALDFAAPLLAVAEDQARALVERLEEWGVRRFVLRAGQPGARRVAQSLLGWGYGFDLRDVHDLGAYLQAVRCGASSVASDFGLAARPSLRRELNTALGRVPPVVRMRPRTTPPRRPAPVLGMH